MKRNVVMMLLVAGLSVLTAFQKSGNREPWSEQQLISAADLAKRINDPKSQPIVIYNIGPAGAIKGSIEIGAAQEAENLASLRQHLAQLPHHSDVVIYCGCCPFGNCPNIRPAFKLLNEMKFENGRLLNLPRNLRVNWISKGYPMDK